MGRKPAFKKFIYKGSTPGTFKIVKTLNGKTRHYGTFYSLKEAMDYRDLLISNNWEPLPLTPEEEYQLKQDEYYKRIRLSKSGLRYKILNINHKYLGSCESIEDALYFRDKYEEYDHKQLPEIIDLSDNPYTDNLEYSVPERLKKRERKISKGCIRKAGPAQYHLLKMDKRYKKNYICSCRTYEMAWYVQHELMKRKWNREELPEILDDYPLWYTKLLELYRYIGINKKSKEYTITIPREHLASDKSLEKYTGYKNVEDALYERDFLVAHDWDYDALVECIDDTQNPYYDMILPPYPERKIRNLRERNYHEKELTKLYELINENPEASQTELCNQIGASEVTVRNWLNRFWNSNYTEFKQITLSGENPLEVLEKVPHIYQPDLSKSKPHNFKGYISRSKSKSSPYLIRYNNREWGYYNTREQAQAAVKKLIKCNWDRSKLASIKESVGWKTALTRRDNVYPTPDGGWTIRKKDSNRKMTNYGYYKDKQIAEYIKDALKLHNWDKKEYPRIRKLIEYTVPLLRLLKCNMFSGIYNTNDLDSRLLFDENILDYDILTPKNELVEEYGK